MVEHQRIDATRAGCARRTSGGAPQSPRLSSYGRSSFGRSNSLGWKTNAGLPEGLGTPLANQMTAKVKLDRRANLLKLAEEAASRELVAREIAAAAAAAMAASEAANAAVVRARAHPGEEEADAGQVHVGV